MTTEMILNWFIARPIESLILLFFILIIFGVFLLLGRVKTLLANELNTRQNLQQHLQQQLDSDNEDLKTALGKLSEAFVIRSQHWESLSQQQHQHFRQESELTKNTLSSVINRLTEQLHHQQQQQQEAYTQNFFNLQRVIAEQLKNQTEQVRQNVDSLNKTTENRLKEIAGTVNKQLEQGIVKTQTTFTDIQKRLSVIDEAQKRIDYLSSNVVSLQNVLTDKKTRGAFGEIQLQTIVENALPPQFVDFQYTLSNGKRADCIIHLPDPSGDMVIDAKFPLESYRRLVDGEPQNTIINQIFKKDIKKHITDIADKYIFPPETAESAILFLPAEAIFSEIHANHPDLVEFSQHHQVWLASPTTLMAILATAKSVIKDDATRRQSHILREQLHKLRDDFDRFQSRMDNLAKRIELASRDVAEVSTSANKISKHFRQIEATETWDSLPTENDDSDE